MIRSANLNIIIKALDKISSKMARDFGEIENLQSNNFAALKFANACYKSVKEKIVRDLDGINPGYNIKFTDGEEIIKDVNAQFCYIIAPIDGLLNFSRSITSFTNFIGLEENIDGKKEITNVAISNVAQNEIYFASKGGGSYLNNRRIRISQAKPLGNVLCALTNQSLLKNKVIDELKFNLRLSNCASLDIAHLAAGKLDLAAIDVKDRIILDSLALLIKEAGGSLNEKGSVILAGNPKLI